MAALAAEAVGHPNARAMGQASDQLADLAVRQYGIPLRAAPSAFNPTGGCPVPPTKGRGAASGRLATLRFCCETAQGRIAASPDGPAPGTPGLQAPPRTSRRASTGLPVYPLPPRFARFFPHMQADSPSSVVSAKRLRRLRASVTRRVAAGGASAASMICWVVTAGVVWPDRSHRRPPRRGQRQLTPDGYGMAMLISGGAPGNSYAVTAHVTTRSRSAILAVTGL